MHNYVSAALSVWTCLSKLHLMKIMQGDLQCHSDTGLRVENTALYCNNILNVLEIPQSLLHKI